MSSVRTFEESGPTPGSPRWLRVLLFLVLYGMFQWSYQSLRSSAWDAWFIHALTVKPAALMLGVLAPGEGVMAQGFKLVWPGGGLALRAGCDGFEVMGLFICAVLVSDVGWRRGMVALVLGCIATWTLNQLRILALYGASRYARDWFDALHTSWAPLMLIAAVALMYAWTARRPAAPASPSAAV